MLEILAISLGLNETYYRDYFSDGCSIMRCNYYPYCQVPTEVLGTGPHCDPTSITLLHQDHIGGLEVFTRNKWHSVSPVPNSIVINIGDTFQVHNFNMLFVHYLHYRYCQIHYINCLKRGNGGKVVIIVIVQALTNGRYKSSRHRAVVNKHKERRSLAFFMCPNGEREVKPPSEIMIADGTRKYPDFLWSDLLEFTQRHYRVDEFTFPNFLKFLSSKQPDTIVA